MPASPRLPRPQGRAGGWLQCVSSDPATSPACRWGGTVAWVFALPQQGKALGPGSQDTSVSVHLWGEGCWVPVGRDTGRPNEPIPTSHPSPPASSCCTLPAPSHPHRYPAAPLSAPQCCRSPRQQQDAGTGCSLSSRLLQGLQAPAGSPTRWRGLMEALAAPLPTQNGSLWRDPSCPWALLGGLSLGQRVLPGASFLPTLVPLEGRRKGSRKSSGAA